MSVRAYVAFVRESVRVRVRVVVFFSRYLENAEFKFNCWECLVVERHAFRNRVF